MNLQELTGITGKMVTYTGKYQFQIGRAKITPNTRILLLAVSANGLSAFVKYPNNKYGEVFIVSTNHIQVELP